MSRTNEKQKKKKMSEKKMCARRWNGLLPVLALGHDTGDCIVTQGSWARTRGPRHSQQRATTRPASKRQRARAQLMSLKVIYFQSIFLINFYKNTDLYAGIWNKLHQIAVQQEIQKKAEIAVKRSRMCRAVMI